MPLVRRYKDAGALERARAALRGFCCAHRDRERAIKLFPRARFAAGVIRASHISIEAVNPLTRLRLKGPRESCITPAAVRALSAEGPKSPSGALMREVCLWKVLYILYASFFFLFSTSFFFLLFLNESQSFITASRGTALKADYFVKFTVASFNAIWPYINVFESIRWGLLYHSCSP